METAGTEMKVIETDKIQKEKDDLKLKSRRIDYKSFDNLFYASRYLFECGYKLKANPISIATAATIFHRFFKEFDTGYDKYLIAATSLYIAGKMNDESYKLRDVINVAHQTLHRGSAPLDLKDEYWARRDAVVQAELLVMRALKFQVKTPLPHKYMLHYLKTIKSWLPKAIWDSVPLSQASMAFLQDFHHDSAILEHPPQLIAIACIQMAMQCYGVDLPYIKETDESAWYLLLYKNVKKDDIWNIIDTLIEMYNKEPTLAD